MADEHATLTSPGITETQSSSGARSPESLSTRASTHTFTNSATAVADMTAKTFAVLASTGIVNCANNSFETLWKDQGHLDMHGFLYQRLNCWSATPCRAAQRPTVQKLTLNFAAPRKSTNCEAGACWSHRSRLSQDLKGFQNHCGTRLQHAACPEHDRTTSGPRPGILHTRRQDCIRLARTCASSTSCSTIRS